MNLKNIVAGIFFTFAFIVTATNSYQITYVLASNILVPEYQTVAAEIILPSAQRSLALATISGSGTQVQSGIHITPTVIRNAAGILSLTYNYTAVNTVHIARWATAISCPAGVTAVFNNSIASGQILKKGVNQCNTNVTLLNFSSTTSNILQIPLVFTNTASTTSTVGIKVTAAQGDLNQIGMDSDSEIVLSATQPTINSLSLSSGPAGTAVTVSGSGFFSGYSVGWFANSPSAAGFDITPTTLSGSSTTFIVPSNAIPGTYYIRIETTSGQSNAVSFVVSQSSSVAVPTMSDISPSVGQIGATTTPITIMGTGFTSNNYVLFNGRVAASHVVSTDGKTLSFIVPYTTTPACNLFAASTAGCPTTAINVATGTVSVSVENVNGTSNAITFGVNPPIGVTSTNASVVISKDPNTPLANEIIASNGSTYNQVYGVTLLNFDLSATGNNVILKGLNVNIIKAGGTGSAIITNAYLYGPDGSVIASAPVTNGVVVFNGINYWTGQNATSTYTIKADIQNATGLPVSYYASVSATTVTAQNNLGTPLAASVITGSAVGNTFTFRNVGPEFALISSPTVTKSTSNSQSGNSTSVLSATYDIKATAIGGLVNFGATASSAPAFGTSTANVIVYKDGAPDLSNAKNSQYNLAVSYSQPSTGVTVSPNGMTYTVAQNNTAEFLVTYSISLSGFPSTHTYAIQLVGINWSTPGVAGVQTTNFFSAQTAWRTAAISLP